MIHHDRSKYGGVVWRYPDPDAYVGYIALGLDECRHCGAPSPGKRCRFCGTGEAPTLPPDACPSCRSHVETVTGMADFGEDTLVAQVCNCPTVTIYEVPERGAARLVETKPNPRFYQAVVNADGKTIGYTTRKGGA